MTGDAGAVGAQRVHALVIRANEALAEARTIEEVRRVIDVAAAARVYACQVKATQTSIDYATEIRLRAERRLGELLRESPRNRGARGIGTSAVPRGHDTPPTLEEIGVSRKQSARAQRLAAMPPATFERAIAEAKRGGDLSISRVLVDERRRERHEEISRGAGDAPALGTSRLYSVILADPPWLYRNEAPSSRAVNQYPCMSTDAICALAVPAAERCVLFLWVTAPLLPDGLSVVAAWGFTYKTCGVWVKDRIGQGAWLRVRHELYLVATRGDMPPPMRSDRADSVLEAPRGKHSEKPPTMYERIERAYPDAPRLEMFARSARDGWDRWGLEA